MRVLVGIPDEESVIVAGDLNGHVGEKSEGYEGIHGSFGYEQRNDEGCHILEATDAFVGL